MKASITEQLTSYRAKREALQSRAEAIMEAATSEGRVLNAQEGEQHDGIISDMQACDQHIARLENMEKMAATAKPVAAPNARPEEQGRVRVTAEPADKLPKGNMMARYVISLVRARGNKMYAAELAAHNYRDTPELAQIFRATAVEPGDTTTSGWASQLIPAAQQMTSEFLSLLRPATILGRLNLRNVPFNVAVPLQSGGGTFNWVGEKKAKPVTKLQFGNATLRWAKCAGIIVITDELARFSSPSAEALIRDSMVLDVAAFLDGQFVDPNVADAANVHPASITNSISPKSPSGSGAAAFRYDLSQLVAEFISDSQPLGGAVLLMSSTTAMGLSLLVNELGQPEFPNITMTGGSIQGLPCVVSENVGDKVILLQPRDILLADEGGVTIDMSREASVQMETAPHDAEDSPSEVQLTSLWQDNLVGLRVERYITWKRARTSAVQWIDNVTYGPVDPGSPA